LALLSSSDWGWDGVILRPEVESEDDEDEDGDEDALDLEDDQADQAHRLATELQAHLAEGEVAILVEVGHQALRYLIGFARAVAWDGRQHLIDLDDLYGWVRAGWGIHPTKAHW
jgi:hypothetical protein